MEKIDLEKLGQKMYSLQASVYLQPFHKPLNKIHTGRWISISGSIGLLSILIAGLLRFSKQPFTIYSHWVSNLGTGNDVSDYIFSIGLIITGTLYLISAFSAWSQLWSPDFISDIFLLIATIAITISTIGLIMLSIWDMFSTNGYHTIGAQLFFIGAVIFVSCYGIVFYRLKINQDYQFWAMIILLAAYIFIIPIFFITMLVYVFPGASLSELFTQELDILSNMNPNLGGLRIIEWTVVLCFFYWSLQTARLLSQARKEHKIGNAKKI